ncbi:MAG: hypothetical protein LBE84_06145, partial [Planctomycetota bacterium]|nr:hypothetical protein [Planctomycetota bacterium]
LSPPAFEPSCAMRGGYLKRRKTELDAIMEQARKGEWRPIQEMANHVRGTGAMYGFPNIGLAAENLAKGLQNGDPDCRTLVDLYAKAVAESYV